MFNCFFIPLVIIISTSFSHGVPLNQPFTGSFTYYNDKGYGACGQQINAETEMLVAISYTQWIPNGNPNNDPICRNICLKVDYKGKSITVPIKDKCPSCDSTHADLSQAAFAQLENLAVGHAYNAVLTYVEC
ncbi:unnamed protein product [Meloidogyne enterolobii]|uniref:Uncharacterized protein n=1 Tax=Meloidogyne enterolobii TaxID=390850 RepID=A0ACB0YVR2_MELEN